MELQPILKTCINEALISTHFTERLYKRFLDVDVLQVGYEMEGTRGVYEVVGEIKLSESVKQQISENVGEIIKYPFPKNKTFGVKVIEMRIDPNAVIYFSPDKKEEAKGKVLVFVDSQTNSNGNIIYVIIRENEIKTVYFAKSYILQTKEKLQVDVIATMKAIREKKVR